MNIHDNPNVVGSHHGLLHGQHERVEELNARFAERQFPDQALQPLFSSRPASSKYAFFPMLVNRPQPTVPLSTYAHFHPQSNFSPATTRGPTSFYLANVDTETMLQNRHVPLKNENKMYVPSTYSNMYGEFGAVGRQESLQDRQLLFTKRPLHTELPEIVNRIGQDRFHNNTRTQLRGL